MPAVFQFASFMIDLALEPTAAVHQPRINVDGGAFVEIDRRLGEGVLSAIGEHLPAKAVEALVAPNHFANPLLAGIEGGTCFGAAQVQSPVSAALEA